MLHEVMGKKKIIKQSEEEVLKEKDALEATQKKAAGKASKSRSIEKGQAHIHSSYNNILLTLTDLKGNVIAWSSSGSLGFRGPKKATPFAAAKVVEAVTEKVNKLGLRQLDVYVRGIGSGREAAIRSLAARGFDIHLIKDVTPVPHNGCRPKKPRRV
jgi:small subunit ribosomal protein S11